MRFGAKYFKMYFIFPRKELFSLLCLHSIEQTAISSIAIPIVVGLLLGVAGVMGLLVGGLTAGFTLAVFMANAGGAWDNAKKYVESGVLGGKHSDAHKATVIGDTVGDPFKDTAGPSLNILMKLMTIVALVTVGIAISHSLLG